MKRLLKQLSENLLAPFAPVVWRAGAGPRLLVLMYHRVLPASHPDRPHEQPGMFVSPETLALHLRILKRHFEIVHLDDWARAVAESRPVPRVACALTFDDGWRDNFDYGFPLLQAQGVPATIYLLSDLVGTRYSFWPNRLARLLGAARNGDSGERWPDWLERELLQIGAPVTVRAPLSMPQIDTVIANCKARYTDAELGSLLDGAAAGGAPDGGDRDLMNWDEIRQMAAGGRIRFGSHTRRHTRLDARAPAAVLEDEIQASRGLIEQQLQTAVSSFCYPNGDHSPAALDLVRRSYATAVTTRRGWNSVSSDTHLLNRVGVHEDVSSTAAAFLSRLARAVSA